MIDNLAMAITDKLTEAGCTVEFDSAILKPNFHFVSMVVITKTGAKIAWCSKSFTTFEHCYEYLNLGLDQMIEAIPSLEKAIREQEEKKLN